MIFSILLNIFLIIVIFFLIKYSQNIAKDTKTRNIHIELENQALQNTQTDLLQQIKQLHLERATLLQDIKQFGAEISAKNEIANKSFENYCEVLDFSYELAEREYDAKIRELKQQIEIVKDNSKLAFETYCDTLDSSYKLKEQQYDELIIELKSHLARCAGELESIRATRAAALEAQKREEEMRLQEDFYKIHLSETELNTITLIEDLKPRLPDPRVLSMLIWTTFYQKKITTLCSNVLKKSIPVCGIYKITNIKTGMCYIGQSVDIAKRWKDHVKCGLDIDCPAGNKLYSAMKKDGIISFTFELLEECDRAQLNEKEKFYIYHYQSCDYGYNSTIGNK